MSFVSKEGKFGAEGFNPYSVGSAVFEQMRPERRTTFGSLADVAGTGLMASNPLAGAALKVGGAIVDSYAYDPEAIEIDDRFSSAENPTYTLGSQKQYTSQVEDASGFGNVVTFGRNKRRQRAAEAETRQNYLNAQGRFNTAAQDYFSNKDTMKQYRSMLNTELGLPKGNFLP